MISGFGPSELLPRSLTVRPSKSNLQTIIFQGLAVKLPGSSYTQKSRNNWRLSWMSWLTFKTKMGHFCGWLFWWVDELAILWLVLYVFFMSSRLPKYLQTCVRKFCTTLPMVETVGSDRRKRWLPFLKIIQLKRRIIFHPAPFSGSILMVQKSRVDMVTIPFTRVLLNIPLFEFLPSTVWILEESWDLKSLGGWFGDPNSLGPRYESADSNRVGDGEFMMITIMGAREE